MISNQDVLDKIIVLITRDSKTKEQCKEFKAYKELAEKGVPYGIYLRVSAVGAPEFDGETCYLKLKETKYVNDLYLKLYLKEIVDFLHMKNEDIIHYIRGGFLSVFAEKNSVSRKAADEAETYIRQFWEKEEYSELMEYAEGYRPNSYDIQTVNKKVKDCIYEVAALDKYKELTSNTRGSQNHTEAVIVLGLPFDMK